MCCLHSSPGLPLYAWFLAGEYIAPEKIENVYTRSPFVMQSFVYGNSLRAQVGGGHGWGCWGWIEIS